MRFANSFASKFALENLLLKPNTYETTRFLEFKCFYYSILRNEFSESTRNVKTRVAPCLQRSCMFEVCVAKSQVPTLTA